MTKHPSRRAPAHISAALATLLLSGCSLPAMLSSDSTDVRGVVSINGTALTDGSSTLYEKGKAHFAGGQLGLAANEFQAALAASPQSIEILNALGATYDRLWRFDLADRYYKEAVALDPKNPQTLNNIAYSLMLRGDPGHAIPLLDVAQRTGTPDPLIEANLKLAKSLDEKLRQRDAARLDGAENTRDMQTTPKIGVEPTKPLWIERRSQEVQELVFAGGAKAKALAHESDFGSGPVVVALPRAEQLESSANPGKLDQATPASFRVSISRSDEDAPTAAPLTPVLQAKLVEPKPAPTVPSVAEVEKPKAREGTGEIPLRLIPSASLEPSLEAQGNPALASYDIAPPIQTATAPAIVPSSPTLKSKRVSASSKTPRAAGSCSIEIANGVGRSGMAARFRTFVEAHGLEVRRLTNEHPYSNAKTVVLYKPGLEDRADKLAALLSVPAVPEPTSHGRCEIRLRLGRDFVGFDRTKLGRHSARTKS